MREGIGRKAGWIERPRDLGTILGTIEVKTVKTNNKTKMVNIYTRNRKWHRRVEACAEQFRDRKCRQRKSKKIIEAYRGIACLIEELWLDTEDEEIRLVNISRGYLVKTFGRHYSEIIEDLRKNRLIAVNGTYCVGKFTKSYGVLNPDVEDDDEDYESVEAMPNEIRKYEDLISRCPTRVVYDGVEYRLDIERLMQDVKFGGLGVNQAVRGIKHVMGWAENPGHNYKGGRDYNKFTTMQKVFRKYILGENGGYMDEALDLPAGNILCVSLDAYEKNLISRRELDKAIGFLKQDIYTVIKQFAEKANPDYRNVTRKEFKRYTQIFLNSTKKRFYMATAEVAKFFKKKMPKLYKHIRDYPKNENDNKKKRMYWDFIEIEKMLIEKIQSVLLSQYGIHSIRVHDAVYVDSSLLSKDFDGDKLIYSIVDDLLRSR